MNIGDVVECRECGEEIELIAWEIKDGMAYCIFCRTYTNLVPIDDEG